MAIQIRRHTLIRGIAYTNEGVRVWRAYGVGCSKLLPWSSFCQQSSSSLPQLNEHTENTHSNVSLQTVKARRSAKQTTELTMALARESDSDEETCEKGSGLFYCPEERCIVIPALSSLEKHLDCGKHRYALDQKRSTTRQWHCTQLNWSMALVSFPKL